MVYWRSTHKLGWTQCTCAPPPEEHVNTGSLHLQAGAVLRRTLQNALL